MEPEHDNDSVESYLHRHTGDGTLEQSAASFTVHLSKAREKMSQFALDEPGLWVVKLAQAAVACGAPDVRFTFGRRKVTVKFANKGRWRADEILSGLTAVDLPAEASLFHWTIGLLTVANRHDSVLVWSCGGQEVTLTTESSALESVPDDNMVKLVIHRGRYRNTGAEFWSTPIRYHFKETGHEFKALVDRCRCSPIPIYVDNYRLHRGYLTQTKGQGLVRAGGGEVITSVRGITLAVLPLQFRSGRGLAYPISDQEDFELLPKLKEILKGHRAGVLPSTANIGAVLSLHTFDAGTGRLHYVCDGALLEDRPWRPASALVSGLATSTFDWKLNIYIAVDHRQLDLSQFKVREEPAGDALDAEIAHLVASVMEGLVEVSHLGWKLPAPTEAERIISNTTPWEVVLAGISIPFLPHLAFASPFALAAKAWKKSQRVFNTHCSDFKLVVLALKQAGRQLRNFLEEQPARSE